MRAKPTEAERRLWSLLRNKRLGDHKFKRQQVIGRYIVDFVNFERRLIIEADGSQHVGSQTDLERTTWLETQGFRVMRFFNDDILARTEAVAEAIWHALPPLPPIATRQAPPSPTRGEGVRNTSHA